MFGSSPAMHVAFTTQKIRLKEKRREKINGEVTKREKIKREREDGER